MTPAAASRRNALVALALLSLIWSYNWIVMKQALRYSGPFEFAALRSVFGTLVLFAVLLLRRESLRPPPLLPTLLIGLAQAMAFPMLVQWALVEGGAGKTALLAYTMPFWLVLLGWMWLAERPGLRLQLGLGVAAAGLVLVLEPWLGFGNARSSALALVAGLCWAIGVVLSKRVFQRGGVSAVSLTAWSLLFGTLGLVLVALCVEERAIEWSTTSRRTSRPESRSACVTRSCAHGRSFRFRGTQQTPAYADGQRGMTQPPVIDPEQRSKQAGYRQ